MYTSMEDYSATAPDAIIIVLPYKWSYIEAERWYWSKEYIEQELIENTLTLTLTTEGKPLYLMGVPLTDAATSDLEESVQYLPAEYTTSTIINYNIAVKFVTMLQITSLPALVVKVNGEYQKPQYCKAFEGEVDGDETATSNFSKAMEHYNAFDINLAAR